MALKPPVEVPQGAIRLNTDSQKLEFYAQDQWWEMATDVPTLDGGSRGLFGGGYTPSFINTINYITIETQGNAIDFGDLTYTDSNVCSSGASRTRGMWFGGGEEPSAENNNINYVTIATTGNAADFGDLTQARRGSATVASATRAVICGGRTPTIQNIMDYVTMASTGNAVDFGDTVNQARNRGSVSVPTLGFVYSGTTSSGNGNTIEKITIQTTGNSIDSGFDLIQASSGDSASNAGSGRCVFFAKATSPYALNQFNAYSMSNSYNFGDLSGDAQSEGGSACSPIRGLFCMGGPSYANTIEYITIATQGDGIDFGDLTAGRTAFGSLSNAHGGL